jgi:hypothetical protein
MEIGTQGVYTPRSPENEERKCPVTRASLLSAYCYPTI